jgi:hypothetical protein
VYKNLKRFAKIRFVTFEAKFIYTADYIAC